MDTLQNEFITHLKQFIHFLPCIDERGNDIYHCTCGNKIQAVSNSNTYIFDVNFENANFEGEMDFVDFSNAYKKTNVICPTCEKDYSVKDNFTLIQNINTNFLERYSLEENENELTLYRIRGGAYGGDEITFMSQISNLTINKSTKQLFVKLFDGEQEEIHLNKVVSTVRNFFKANSETTISEGFIHLHDFMGRIAKHVIDAKNMNIVEELMTQMVGKSGIDIIEKIVTILLGIMCYPNLSTIALTKNNSFLYDLICNCPLPEKEILINNKATSPIKIFNLLVSLQNKVLQKDLDSDDLNKLGYTFKSSKGVDYKIHYNREEIDNLNNEHLHREGAKVFVRDEIQTKTISPYIFNKLIKFDDYNKVIQWLKFITYENLIQLVMEYDIEFLNIALSKIEFRDDITMERIKQFLPIMLSYREVALDVKKTNAGLEEIPTEWVTYDIIKQYDFNLYDDCARMIAELGWDQNKVLNKVKDYKKLAVLHGDLLKHRSYISNTDVNKKFIEFASKFDFLENYSENINVYFDIKLISTPEELMNEAIEMHNCAGSYIRRVANGEYVAFIVKDNSPLRAKDEYHKYMMVIEITYTGFEFVGIKSNFNKYGSDRFKQDVKRYLIDKSISFKEVPSIRTGIQSSEISYEGTFEKMTPAKA